MNKKERVAVFTEGDFEMITLDICHFHGNTQIRLQSWEKFGEPSQGWHPTGSISFSADLLDYLHAELGIVYRSLMP